MTARRKSARLSGENPSTITTTTSFLPTAVSNTRKRRSGDLLEGGNSQAEQVDAARKKQKVAAITMKPTGRGRKPAFEPAPIVPDSPESSFQPPPPPPSVSRPLARHRQSLKAHLPEEEETGRPSNTSSHPTTTTSTGGGRAAPRTTSASANDKKQVAGSKNVGGGGGGVKNGNGGRGKSVGRDEDVEGLEAGTRLVADLGDERGRWQAASKRLGTHTNDKDTLRHLEALKSSSKKSQPIISAPRPRTPPLTVPIDPTTPGTQLSKRILPRKSFAGGYNSDFNTPGRGGDTNVDLLVAMPIVDTPLVSKTKQDMREEASSRRSARGSRMSESLARSGEINMPHASVPDQQLFRTLNPSLSEAKRVQQLALWTIRRADQVQPSSLPAKRPISTLDPANKNSTARDGKSRGKGKQKEVGPPVSEMAQRASTEVLARLLQGIKIGIIPMNPHPPPGIIPDYGGLRPHPRNTRMRKIEATLNASIDRDKTESELWSTEIVLANKRLQNVAPPSSSTWTPMDPISSLEADQAATRKARGLLSEKALERAREWNALASEILAEEDEEGDMGMREEEGDAEYKVDLLSQSVHQTAQFSNQASRFLDGIFSSLAQDLRNRHHVGSASSSASGIAGVGAPLMTGEAAEEQKTVGLMSAVQTASTSTSAAKEGGEGLKDKGKKVQDDPIELLRALARAESDSQTEEIRTLASRLPPVGNSNSGGSGTGVAVGGSTSGTVPPTPRRAVGGGMTPSRRGAAGAATPKR